MEDFFQSPPVLKNQFTDDDLLQSALRWKLSPATFKSISPHLEKLGARAAGDLFDLADQAEKNPPKLINFDPWGNRIDKIEVSAAWVALEKAAAEEGIVASGYERKYGSDSRIYQGALLYLYHPSSAIFSCPLAMTDGAAKAFELFGEGPLKKEVLSHLTSRDPAQFWTSGQWMTERSGGSDVGQTETVAKKVGNGYELTGTKWFTSAASSQMAMTLARIEGASEGSRGLSLFFVRTKNESGGLNKIELHRLKDKLGTKALPTAELTMNGTPATLIGEEGRGVKNISALFNITRIYNSVCAVGYMRRAYALALDYANKRMAFGKKIIDHPLHAHTLKEMHNELAGNLFFSIHVMKLQGLDDMGEATPQDKAMLRCLTPILKLHTAKKAVALVSEALECFGGAGYVEDTGLPKILRDTQVLAIWEGTTNVLSLDLLRSMEKENTFAAYLIDVKKRLAEIKGLSDEVKAVGEVITRLENFVLIEASARKLAFTMARVFIATLLLDNFSLTQKEEAKDLAQFWISRDLDLLPR